MIRNKEDAGHVIFTPAIEKIFCEKKKIYTFITREGEDFIYFIIFQKNAYESEIQLS